jgi:chaperone modulatory protein CbpM
MPTDTSLTVISGVVLDEQIGVSLRELCLACGVPAESLIAMVEEGLVEPIGGSPIEWRFPASAVQRVRTALRLQEDLQLNLNGAALAVELLEELRSLRVRIHALESTLQPPR